MKTATQRRFLVLLVLSFSVVFLHAVPLRYQVRPNDVSLGVTVSGSGFGMRMVPSAGFIIRNRLILCGGPVFNEGFGRFTGYTAGTRYVLVNEAKSDNGHFRLAAICMVERFNQVRLGNSSLEMEKLAADSRHNDERADFAALRFSGWEYSGGFAVTYRFGFNLQLRGEAMGCWFDTRQMNEFSINTYHSERGIGFRTGVAVGYSLGNRRR
jgi:hypothetical protein